MIQTVSFIIASLNNLVLTPWMGVIPIGLQLVPAFLLSIDSFTTKPKYCVFVIKEVALCSFSRKSNNFQVWFNIYIVTCYTTHSPAENQNQRAVKCFKQVSLREQSWYSSLKFPEIIQVTLGSLPSFLMHFISHSEHLGLIFGNKQTSFLSFVMKNSMALSLENSLGKHDVVEVASMS